MSVELTEKLAILLKGRIPEKIDTGNIADENERELAELFNKFIRFMWEIHYFIIPLSKGQICDIETSRDNFLASPFKELHSQLLHLTWQTKQVANGDYSQRVDFMGEFSEAFNSMIVSLDNREKQLRNKIDELENANHYIENLEGFLPICANCKRIRIEGGDPKKQEDWMEIEGYLSQKTNAQFSHAICPECLKKLYPDFLWKKK